MSRTRSHNRTVALSLLLVAVALWLAVLGGATVASAGVPSTPSTESTTTTQESTTTTTQQVTTTTAARTTTTAPRASTTSVPRSTTSASTTSLPPTTTTTVAPEIVTDDTLPRRTSSSGDGGLSTDTKLALVVGALVAVGVAIGVLTFFYWRHTRPERYMTALDALADVEQKVPRTADDVPTAEHVAVGSAAAGAAGAATSVRILEHDTHEDATPASERSSDGTAHAGTGPVSLDEPTTITTVEDLRSGGGAGGDHGGGDTPG